MIAKLIPLLKSRAAREFFKRVVIEVGITVIASVIALNRKRIKNEKRKQLLLNKKKGKK